VKWSRVFQPRNPVFWMMVLLNLLSSVIAVMLVSMPLATGVRVLLAVFALGNAAFGVGLALRLMRSPDAQA